MAESLPDPFWRRRADSATPAQVNALLVLMFAARHFGYYHAPDAWQGQVFSAAGAVCIIVLVALLKPWLPLLLWITAEEAQVAGCSVWAVLEPIGATSEQCSEQIGFQIGSVGLVWLALLAHRLTLSDLTASRSDEWTKK